MDWEGRRRSRGSRDEAREVPQIKLMMAVQAASDRRCGRVVALVVRVGSGSCDGGGLASDY